jgi:hypothetical protein
MNGPDDQPDIHRDNTIMFCVLTASLIGAITVSKVLLPERPLAALIVVALSAVVDVAIAVWWFRRRGPSLWAPGATEPVGQPAGMHVPTDDGVRLEQLKTISALRDSGALTEKEFQEESRRIADASGRRRGSARGRVASVLRNTLVVLTNVVGVIMVVLGVVAAANGWGWFFLLFGLSLGLIFMFGFPQSRVLKAGISRTPEIVCRYVPWFQGNFYVLVALPLLVISGTGLGLTTGWDAENIVGAIAGIVLLALAVSGFRSQARLWRRCRLRIGQSELAIEVIKAGAAPIVIPREAVQAINTKIVDDGGVDGSPTRYVALVYGGGGGQPETIHIGRQRAESGLLLSVKPQNLERALAAWKNGGSDDPELLDRVEAILRGRSATVLG